MIKDLIIKATKNTPSITTDKSRGHILIEGSSFPENVNDFYAVLTDWVSKARIDNDNITIETHFYYIASSSIIALLKFFKKIEKLYAPEKITINWHYDEDDEDILRNGEDYQKLFSFQINLISKKEE